MFSFSTNLVRRGRLAFRLAACAWLVATCAWAADEAATELDGCQERIEYYELAATDLREAIGVCDRKAAEVRGAQALASNDGDQAALRARQDEVRNLEQLRLFHVNKLVDTLDKLVAEYEKLAERKKQMRLYAEALDHTCSAAEVWEDRADVFEKAAAVGSADSGFDAAAQQLERAHDSYRKANNRWQEALRLQTQLEQENDEKQIRHHVEASLVKSVAALRGAASAYFNAYQYHRKRAKEQSVDIYNRNAGDGWLRTAQAQQNHERVVRALAAMEKTL